MAQGKTPDQLKETALNLAKTQGIDPKQIMGVLSNYRFIKSSSITTTSTNLVITLSTTPTLTNLKRFCLVLAQSLPSGANTLPVQIQIGTMVYPVYTRTGNLLRADQIRCRRVYPIIFGSDPNHFSMLCCVPNTVYTPTAPTVPTVEVLED